MSRISFDYRGADDIALLLDTLSSDEVSKDMIRAGEPILKKAIIKKATLHKKTGAMLESIKSTEPKKNKYGWYSVVRPTGKDSKGVRNMEKMAYLEYGAVHRGQPATPVLAPAVNESEQEVLEAMQNEFDRRAEL